MRLAFVSLLFVLCMSCQPAFAGYSDDGPTPTAPVVEQNLPGTGSDIERFQIVSGIIFLTAGTALLVWLMRRQD